VAVNMLICLQDWIKGDDEELDKTLLFSFCHLLGTGGIKQSDRLCVSVIL